MLVSSCHLTGVVVTTVSPAARDAGLHVGDLVLTVDSQPIDDAIADLPPQLRFGSTERSRRDWALANLISVWGTDESLSLTVQTASAGAAGETQTLTLTVPADEPVDEPADAPLVTGERLPSGIGLIRLSDAFQTRPEHDIVSEFDAALDGLMDTPGLIIDLRANGGGNSSLAEETAGRLLAQPVTHGREYYRSRLPTRAWWPWSERNVTPRPPIYAGPVILLIDATNVSTAEEFIVALVDSGRARTGGSVGNPLSVELPGGGLVRFSSGEFRRMDGTPVEEVGIMPDVSVEWTVEDVRAGRDPDLEAAEALILDPDE